MKKALVVILLVLLAVSAHAATDVGVSIGVSQPGFYGRIDIGNAPRPEVIYARPVVIQPAPAHVVYEPLYLHVPPGHAKNWRKHCAHYNACNRPVYFVREKWYKDVYVPHRKAHYAGHVQKNHNGKAHGERDWNDHDRGPGEHGRGHGR